MTDQSLLDRLFSQKISPMTPALLSCIREAGFPVPSEDMESFWLPYLASLVIRKGPHASPEELLALMVVLKHLGPKDGLELSCELADIMTKFESP